MALEIGRRPGHGFDEPLGLLTDCHRRIEHFLQVLEIIARDAGGGALTERQRPQLEGALTYFAEAAPRHTADEEESLFPRLKAAGGEAADLIARLEHDHGVADAHHQAVETLVRRWLADGRLSGGELADLRSRLAALRGIYDGHIAVEDQELFPAAARLLSPEQLREIGQEMARRRSR
jgi:hemerythrin-like domain-containing protein